MVNAIYLGIGQRVVCFFFRCGICLLTNGKIYIPDNIYVEDGWSHLKLMNKARTDDLVSVVVCNMLNVLA